jgi:hypothetical protein
MFYVYDSEEDKLPVYNISVEQWDSMTIEEQENYIINNGIKAVYTHDISDTLKRGFGM